MINRFYYRIIFLLGVITCTLNIQAQTQIDSIEEKIGWYGLHKPSTTLFVHFDKNIYTSNENVWFTGYLLKRGIKDSHRVLSVALVRNDDRSVLAEGKYMFYDLVSLGNLFLPDSLPTGDYTFVCYTNHLVNGYPSVLFTQPITIKTANTPGFIANLSLVDSIKPGIDTANILLRAHTPDIRLVKGATVNWFIGNRANPLKTGKLKTDNFGEAKMTIPLKEITTANNVLYTEVNHNKEIKTFNIRLPVYNKEATVKFYPEGGNLVSGATNTVGWEVLNNEGEPLFVTGVLYQDDQALQTIQTNAHGIGKFLFMPKHGSRYYVKLTDAEGSPDKMYTLPIIIKDGPVITIVNALTLDTLVVQINNQQPGSMWHVMIHNYKTTFIKASVAGKNASMLVKIPLQEVPMGLNTFILLDTLGRPWAERLFFAHFNNKPIINITTDSTSYFTRQKVALKFKVTNAQQKPIRSVVSVACAQDNRFDLKKMTDIESYNYLHAELAAIPFKNKLVSGDADNKIFLENLLLVKGWRRYTWNEMSAIKAPDTIRQTSSLAITGAALMNNKRLKKPVQLNIIKSKTATISSLDFTFTDSVGNFELSPDQLLSEPGKEVQLSVNDKQRDKYSIKVKNAYEELNKKLASTLLINNYNIKSFRQTTETVVLKKEEGGHKLLDVTVVAKNDNSIYRSKPGPNACGDYVCVNGILNCANHPFDGTHPIVGMRYSKRNSFNQTPTTYVYTGCEALNKEKEMEKQSQAALNGFYLAKQFYVPDYSKVDAADPQYASTLYWNYSILNDEKGEAEVTFYTSDIPGKFRVVIQGITGTNVVYGEHFFEVKKQ
ncbi:MAG TPA: hypothetical protein VF622_20730 [Segetibacter sp.]